MFKNDVFFIVFVWKKRTSPTLNPFEHVALPRLCTTGARARGSSLFGFLCLSEQPMGKQSPQLARVRKQAPVGARRGAKGDDFAIRGKREDGERAVVMQQ